MRAAKNTREWGTEMELELIYTQSSDDKSKVTLELNKVRALVDATTAKIK